MSKNSSTWKIIAILFIILFIFENIFFIFAYLGSLYDSKYESICRVDICTNNISNSFNYDWEMQICTCYYNGEIVETIRMETYLNEIKQ